MLKCSVKRCKNNILTTSKKNGVSYFRQDKMYHMKNIISSEEHIQLPKCMYNIKNSMKIAQTDDTEINICDQVIKFLKTSQDPIMELEERQDKLLIKLDALYERIKNISLLCKPVASVKQATAYNKINEGLQREIVVILGPDTLPWFLNIFTKDFKGLNMTWHIHSTVKNEKISKINNFFKRFQNLSNQQDAKINVRLIFKNVTSDPELKISSLDIPIIGTVNIIRYLCLTFQNIVPYDYTDHNLEALLDLVFLLERVSDKSKEQIFGKIFSNCKNWIHKDEFSIVDLAVFNVVKQSQNLLKFVPKQWYDSCEKKCNLS